MTRPKSGDKKRLGSDPLAALLEEPEPEPQAAPTAGDHEQDALLSEFTLDDEMAIADVSHWREKFLHCNMSADVRMDARMVQRVDTAGAQLLLALAREIQQANGTLRWIEPSERLLETAALLGLSEALGLPQNAHT